MAESVIRYYERFKPDTICVTADSLISAEAMGAKGTGFILSLLKYQVQSITYDNRLEFSKHEAVSKTLASEGYFCHPYSSWEKGDVENFNGLVRQYMSKGSSFHDLE